MTLPCFLQQNLRGFQIETQIRVLGHFGIVGSYVLRAFMSLRRLDIHVQSKSLVSHDSEVYCLLTQSLPSIRALWNLKDSEN